MAQEALITNLSDVIAELPLLLTVTDYVFYIVGILFFGMIATKGFRGYLGILPYWGLRVVMGLVSMIGGISLAGYFPQLSGGIFSLMNADIVVGAFVSSISLAIGLYLLSFRLINIGALEKRIEKIQERIKKGKSMNAKKRGIRDPVKIIGIVVIIAVVAVGLANFRDFPRASDRFLSFVGISQEDLAGMQEQLDNIQKSEENLPESCDSIISILQETGPDINGLPTSTDSGIISLLEEGSGRDIVMVKEARYSGKDYFLGVATDGGVCHSTSSMFCGCIDVQ